MAPALPDPRPLRNMTPAPEPPPAAAKAGRGRAGRGVRRRTGGRAKEAALKPEVIPADLARLADEIRESYGALVDSARTTFAQARRIGQLLAEVKELAGHGRFGRWVEEHCSFSRRTASDYVRLARYGDALPLDDPNRQNTANLSIASAMKALARPRAEPASGDAEATGGGTGGAETTDTRVDNAKEPTGAASADGETGPEARADGETTGAQDDRGEGGRRGEDGDGDRDQRWLASLPIRAQLADPRAFDADALLWCVVQPAVEHLAELSPPTLKDLKCASVDTFAARRYPSRIAFLTGVKPPREWRLCPKCDGASTDAPHTIPCGSCGGAGYWITHVGTDHIAAGGCRTRD
jgi:hypothetical protein